MGRAERLRTTRLSTSFTAPNIEGSLKEPDAVATDPSGNIWVGDSGHDRVLEFNSKREYLRQFGSAGSGEGQFQGIAGHRRSTPPGMCMSRAPTASRSSPPPGPISGSSARPARATASSRARARSRSTRAATCGCSTASTTASRSSPPRAHTSGSSAQRAPATASSGGPSAWPSRAATCMSRNSANSRVQEFSTAGTYLGQFGWRLGQRSVPRAVGHRLRPEQRQPLRLGPANSRIEEFGPSGAFIAAFGTRAPGAGQVLRPQG